MIEVTMEKLVPLLPVHSPEKLLIFLGTDWAEGGMRIAQALRGCTVDYMESHKTTFLCAAMMAQRDDGAISAKQDSAFCLWVDKVLLEGRSTLTCFLAHKAPAEVQFNDWHLDVHNLLSWVDSEEAAREVRAIWAPKLAQIIEDAVNVNLEN